jgi:hypothetical protein
VPPVAWRIVEVRPRKHNLREFSREVLRLDHELRCTRGDESG